MLYCLNPDCSNPINPDGKNFCQYCRTGLISLLRDRYRIISLLGSGGFGRTFVAEDTDTPSQRRCVIKQLKPIANNPQIYQIVQERFQREAAILEELGEEKEQIPRLYAYFTVAGQFYLVQQWIDGETLTEKVQQQGLMSETTVKNILISLLPVLDYVHSMGIIHRDIKPDNIILRRRDGLPVLIDFGAVKETMGTVVTTQGNPTSSIVIGTPGYMPSEQAAGKPIRSSDLYSLGLTAIYGLTGKLPQEFPIDQDTGDILWHSTAVNFSREFVAVLDKTISWHPRERYSTASAMLNALQSGATPIPPTIPSPQPSVPSTQTVQRQIISSTITSPTPIKKKAQQQHNQQTKEIDWRWLAIALAIATVIYMIFGLFPSPHIAAIVAVILAAVVTWYKEEPMNWLKPVALVVLAVTALVAALWAMDVDKAAVKLVALLGVLVLVLGLLEAARELRKSCSNFHIFLILSGTSLLGIGLGILLKMFLYK